MTFELRSAWKKEPDTQCEGTPIAKGANGTRDVCDIAVEPREEHGRRSRMGRWVLLRQSLSAESVTSRDFGFHLQSDRCKRWAMIM